MMPKDPVISISLGDIIEIYNTLVDKKETRWIDSTPEEARVFKEPISLLRKELGDKRIELGSS